MEEPDACWKAADTEIENFSLDSNTRVRGVGEEGFYYSKETADEDGKPIISYYYRSLSGEDILLYQEEYQGYQSWRMIGADMILSTSMADGGVKVLKLTPSGEAVELFRQNAVQLPYIQWAAGRLLTIRNYLWEGGDYENRLVLSDLGTGEEIIIYQAVMKEEIGKGEDIICAALSDKEVFFAVEALEEESEFWLYIYEIEKGIIRERVRLGEERPLFAAYEGGKVFLSLTDDYTYLQEAGSIGEIIDGEYQELSKVPLISASNLIRYMAFTKEGFFLAGNESGYFWDTGNNKVYVYDFTQVLQESVSRIWPSEHGFACVVQKGDRLFLRTIALERED